MASLTWYGTNTVLSTLSQEMSETSPGANATSSPQMGWVVGTGSTNTAAMDAGTNVASSAFSGTTHPDGSLVTGTGSNGDHFRSTGRYSGSFASGNWTITISVIGVTQAGAHDGRAGVRLFRGPNPDGTSAAEVTSAEQACSAVTNLSTSQQDSAVTFNPGAFNVANEYIFIQVAWLRTGAGGMSTTDVAFRYGTTATRAVSADFSHKTTADPGAVTVTGTDATSTYHYTEDATSEAGLPITAVEYNHFKLFGGITAAAPAVVYRCNDASGNLVPAFGAGNITVTAGASYQQAVTGWSATGPKVDDNDVADGFSKGGVNLSTTDAATFVFVKLGTAGARSLLSLGGSGSTDCTDVSINSSGNIIARRGTNTATGSTAYAAGDVLAIMAVCRQSASDFSVYVRKWSDGDLETLTPTWAAPPNATHNFFWCTGWNPGVSTDATLMRVEIWTSTDAAINATQAGLIIGTRGFATFTTHTTQLAVAATGAVDIAGTAQTHTTSLTVAGAGAATIAAAAQTHTTALAVDGTGAVEAVAAILHSTSLDVAATGAADIADSTRLAVTSLAVDATGAVDVAAVVQTHTTALASAATGVVELAATSQGHATALAVAGAGTVEVAGATRTTFSALGVDGTGVVDIAAAAQTHTTALATGATGAITVVDATVIPGGGGAVEHFTSLAVDASASAAVSAATRETFTSLGLAATGGIDIAATTRSAVTSLGVDAICDLAIAAVLRTAATSMSVGATGEIAIAGASIAGALEVVTTATRARNINNRPWRTIEPTFRQRGRRR